jgi:eukaryotic-like serine/threonine-protein kinase
MKECTVCKQTYPDESNFCTRDGSALTLKLDGESPPEGTREKVKPPEAGLPVRLTIVDADDEGRKSHTISGKMQDMSLQGMFIQTDAVESDSLNIIKDETVAFKNRLDIEIDLPGGTVHIEGFAVWYKPAPDGRNWDVGIYIKDMPVVDREVYESFLEQAEGS